jgi:cobalt-zinc-cadmium efflux system outer membrane protein
MYRISHLSFSILLLAPWPALAQESPESLPEAIRHAWTAHPAIKVAEKNVEGNQGLRDVAGRWDDPSLAVEFRDDRFDGGDGAGSVEAVFSQPVPLAGRTRFERAVREQELSLAHWALADLRRRLAYDVERAHNAWVAATETAGDDKDILAINQELVAFLKHQVERGEASALDVGAMEVIAHEVTLDLLRAESGARAALRDLHRAMGLGVGQAKPSSLALWDPLPDPSDEASIEVIMDRRPDVQLAELRLAMAGEQIRLERARRWQDADVGLIVESSYGGDADATLLGAGISLPMPLWNRNAPAVAEAAMRESVEAGELNRIRFDAAAEIADSRAVWRDAREHYRSLNESLLPAEEERQAAIRKGYEQGLLGLIELRQAQERWIRLRSDMRSSRAAIREAAARLRFVQADYETFRQTIQQD